MKKALLATMVICFTSFTMAQSLAAAINQSTPAKDRKRELAICVSNLDLCNDVADIDNTNCQPTGKNCSGEHLEDSKVCANDYATCVGNVSKINEYRLKLQIHQLQNKLSTKK